MSVLVFVLIAGAFAAGIWVGKRIHNADAYIDGLLAGREINTDHELDRELESVLHGGARR